MDNILAIQQPESLFRSTYPMATRIWHWVTYVTLTSSIVMVILASTTFSTGSNLPMVQQQLLGKGQAVSVQAARAVAHEYSDKLWMKHKYIGFGLCFLLLFRGIIELSYSREKRLAGKIRHAMTLQTQTMKQRYDRKHYLWVKWGYVAFYFMILVMAITGLGLAFEDVPFLRDIRKPLSGIHKTLQFGIYAYLFFHLAGVIRADMTDNKGIVSRMINGGERDAPPLPASSSDATRR